MKNHCLLLIVIISVLLTSCEGPRENTGKIVSSVDNHPLDHVRITYYGDTAYTDSAGHYDLFAFIGCGFSDCPDFEIYVEKEGFKTKYINLSKLKQDHNSDEFIIKLDPTTVVKTKKPDTTYSDNVLNLSRILMLLTLISFIGSFFIKTPHRLIWILIILFGNFCFKYNSIAEIFDFRPFSFIFTTIYQYNWDIYYLPLGTIIFWTVVIVRQKKKLNSM